MFSLTYLAGHTTQDVIAMAAALKEAYPDEKTRPDYVKVLIEKAKKETAKDVARAFFSVRRLRGFRQVVQHV